MYTHHRSSELEKAGEEETCNPNKSVSYLGVEKRAAQKLGCENARGRLKQNMPNEKELVGKSYLRKMK